MEADIDDTAMELVEKLVAAKAEIARLRAMNEPLNWRAYTPETQFYDGDSIVAAVQVQHADGPTSWEIAVLEIQCDDESNAILCDDNDWSWAVTDIEWWLPLSELMVTLPEEKP